MLKLQESITGGAFTLTFRFHINFNCVEAQSLLSKGVRGRALEEGRVLEKGRALEEGRVTCELLPVT